MRGKYSPTVTEAYRKNQNWFENYAGDAWYDPEGYDQYGYDKNDMDRAGNYEHEYYHSDYFYNDDDYNGVSIKYDDAERNSTFDGVKPVVKK